MVFNALLIGLGNIGMIYDYDISSRNIFSHAKALTTHSDFFLIGGVDPIEKNREKFKSRYNENVYSKIGEIPRDIRIDLVVVATPTSTHLKVIKEIKNHLNVKNILCEKPLSYNLLDSKEIVNFCKEKKINLYVNYTRRCDPGVLDIKNKINSGFIKEPIKGVCWYSKGLYNSSCHFINLLSFWLGKFKESKVLFKGRLFNNIDPEPDFYINFEKGGVYFLSAWEEFYSFYKIELITRNGFLNYDFGGENINYYKKKDSENNINNLIRKDSIVIKNDLNRYQLNVFEELSKSLKGKNSNICFAEEALETEKIISSVNQKLNL